MTASKFLACLFSSCLILQLSLEVRAACVCNEKGTDYCSACNERRVVRPKPKYYDSNSDLGLSPIGDNCWCSKQMIEPASLPKPCPKHKTPSCGCSSTSQATYDDSAHSYPTPLVNYVPADKPIDDSLPADPISVSLAIQAGKTIGVPEAKLAYGFVQKPLDGLKKIYFSNVPEEDLFKLKSDVITLKRRNQYIPKEEEPIDAEEEEDVAENDDTDEQPHFTYRQLGYRAEQFKNPKFRQVSSSDLRDDGEENSKPVYGRFSVDCGFRPGRISAYRKQYEYAAPPAKYASSCY